MKNDDLLLYYDIINTHHKLNYGDFSSDIDYYNSKTDAFKDVIYLTINQLGPDIQRIPLVDKNCPPAPQRKQAKRTCQE